MLTDLKKKITSKKAKVGIIGLGYVGLPLAVLFAKKGFRVHGIDVDKERVDRLKKCESYILDVPTQDIIDVTKDKKLSVTTDFSVIKDLDAVIICVPTPLNKTKEPDVSYIVSAVENIKKYMKHGQIVVLESTTYPGTTEEVMLPVLESTGLKEGKDFYLAFSPERIDPGNEKYGTENTPKVIGGLSKQSTDLAKMLYEQVIDKIIPVSSSKVAEMVKLLENTFRIVNIGLVNEIMLMCDKLGIDVWEVIEAAKSKPYGFMPFYPGPGVGGHCLGADEYIYVKDKGDISLKIIKISDFVKEAVNNQESLVHKVRDSIFIKPVSKEVLSYDAKSQKTCFKSIKLLSERAYNDSMLNIKTQDNRVFSVTPKHPVMVVKDGTLGVKFADELSIGDEIPIMLPTVIARSPEPTTVATKQSIKSKASQINGTLRELEGYNGLATTKVSKISNSFADKVYSMEVADTNVFFTSYGVLTHNCIPVDPIYLSWKARGHGFEARFIDLSSHVNSQMPHYVVEKIASGLNERKKALKGSNVLVMGVAYKKDVKDLRESPALEIISILEKKGVNVSYHDPYLSFLKMDDIDLKSAKFNKETLKKADCVVIVTDHSNIDYKFIAANAKLVVDTRNVLRDIKDKKNIIRL